MPPFKPGNKPSTKGCGPAGVFGRRGPFAPSRGSRMFGPGALRLLTLGLIAEAPRSGYDVIKTLRDQFQGAYAPSPGAIYPILKQLRDAELVHAQSEGRSKMFTITPAGQAYLRESEAELDRIREQIETAANPIEETDMGEAIRGLRDVVFNRMRDGSLTEAQAQKLRDILTNARKEIEDL